MLDTIIVSLIVGATVMVFARSYYRSLVRKKHGCSGCSSCPVSSSCGPVVQKIGIKKLTQKIS